MSATRKNLDDWHAELDKRHAERMEAQAKARQQCAANKVEPRDSSGPSESTFDADRETARGIRSIWD